MSVLLAPLCPYITALHCFGGTVSTSPNISTSACDESWHVLTGLHTEIVLGKTAGPNTMSRPHFLPRGVAEGWPRDPSPESSSGIFAA